MNTPKILSPQCHLPFTSGAWIRGTGILLAFCRHWVWVVLQQLLDHEGYTDARITENTAVATIKQAIAHRGWEHNKAGKLAILYLIGKGKSIQKGQWLWRGITALPQPLAPRPRLRIAARANTTFLRLLIAEIPCAFFGN